MNELQEQAVTGLEALRLNLIEGSRDHIMVSAIIILIGAGEAELAWSVERNIKWHSITAKEMVMPLIEKFIRHDEESVGVPFGQY
ncbi:MAG: hypothetical protein JRE23_14745 [Deltaproteobacteria bacterium]|nr:hypothetical protein [Deltaproteobacteria bacterium]